MSTAALACILYVYYMCLTCPQEKDLKSPTPPNNGKKIAGKFERIGFLFVCEKYTKLVKETDHDGIILITLNSQFLLLH